MVLSKKITIVEVLKPREYGLNQEIRWFSDSFGIFSSRDKEKSCYRLFLELLKASKKNYLISSDELAHMCHLSRGTTVHHLNKLMMTGIVIKQGKRYLLRVQTLSSLVNEIKKDLERLFLDIKESAEIIDKDLALKKEGSNPIE